MKTITERYIKLIKGLLKIDELSIDITNSLEAKGSNYIGELNCIICISKYKQISFFRLIDMPGCCGIIISTSSFIHLEYRNKGLGLLLNQMRIELSQYLGYGLLICTDIEDNKHQQKILTKNKWSKIDSFINPRTKNKVNIHSIKLT